jgi:hypothetical protein
MVGLQPRAHVLRPHPCDIDDGLQVLRNADAALALQMSPEFGMGGRVDARADHGDGNAVGLLMLQR